LLPPPLTSAERGRRLAERTGCFACHGPEGRGGVSNPGRTDRTVPDFSDDVMMYAKDRDAVRQWIEDGVTAAKAGSVTWQQQRKQGALRMPAFEHRLSAAQIADLVAYVEATAGRPEPEDSLARLGLQRARALGCVGCHGAGGRLERQNPGSLRGYVPSWDGPDFPELVSSRAEFAEWVERGVSRRFERNAAARFFIRRAAVKMPAYARHLDSGDADALWAYIGWLRTREQQGRSD
jgi:mono/diheme cytochrome c family protein